MKERSGNVRINQYFPVPAHTIVFEESGYVVLEYTDGDTQALYVQKGDVLKSEIGVARIVSERELGGLLILTDIKDMFWMGAIK